MRGTLSGMEADAPIIVADRLTVAGYDLAPPEETPAGHLIVEAVLATPGVMPYSWGPTYTPPGVLADAAWLASLVGAPITDDDDRAHTEGVTPDTTQRVRVGTVLSARWDEAQQAVIGRLIFDVRRGIDKIRAGVRGVSPAYETRLLRLDGVDAASGLRYTHVQQYRARTDNVALTPRPRGGPAAQLLADSMAENGAETEKEAADAASMEARVAKLEDAVKELSDAYGKMKADAKKAADADTGATVATPEPVKAAEVAKVLRAADAHGVEVGTDDTLDTLRARVAAKVLGRDVAGLSADALDVAVSLAPPVKGDPLAHVTFRAADSDRAGTPFLSALRSDR